MTPESYFASYFKEHRTNTGLTQDRASSNICSTAAAGFGNVVIALTCPKQEAIDKVNQTLDALTTSNPNKNRGWLYHFTTPYGLPALDSEVSTIDTAIFYTGCRLAAKLIGDTALTNRVENLITSIDINWLARNGLFCHGVKWVNEEPYFIPYFWDDYNEGIIIYKLFGLPYCPLNYRYDLPIFAYYYPLAFYPEDKEIKSHLEKAIECHFAKYGHLVTSTDTEMGYSSFAIGYISPITMYTLGLQVEIPTIHSYRDGWYSTDRIGIDEGAAFLIKKLSILS